MFLVMRREMKAEMASVIKGEKKKIAAFRDFSKRFDVMAGDYRPEAYYAECVDLL